MVAEEGEPVMLLQTGSHVSQLAMFGSTELEPVDLALQQEALLQHQSLVFEAGEDCPTTYVYDIPELWDLEVPMKEVPKVGEQLIQKHWGSYCGHESGAYQLNQYDMPAIVIIRLLTSQRCKVTSDPKEADLFLVPYRPAVPRHAERCRGQAVLDPTPYLTHLNEQTAHKHLFLLGKGHPMLAACGNWWKTPTNLLRRAIRVTYSMAVRPRTTRRWPLEYGPRDSGNLTLGMLAHLSNTFNDDDAQYPHTFSVPYPATGVLGSMPLREPWKNSETLRPILAFFMGKVHGLYGADVREKIIDDCSKVGYPVCTHWLTQDKCTGFALKEQALFCLEPGGDSPYRKSVFDDLASGCIPVLFSPYMQLVAPWHWGHFRNDSYVYINRDDYLQGRLDLFEELKKIAASPRLQQLRRSIAANAHAVQYSQRDYPGDGVERLLVGAKHAAQQWERKNGRPTAEVKAHQ